FADVQEAADPNDGDFDIELDLRFTFNDIVDPDPEYGRDTVRSWFAYAVTLGHPKDYRLSISWASTCLAEVRHGKVVHVAGYPSEYPTGVRAPLSKLDVTGPSLKLLRAIEPMIVKELQRTISSDDVAGLADRKRRLLWLF